tara:strand:+ start:402 stop:725 length:324 start_codon:yes stop_codon:yes gene_type:complete
MTKYSNVTPYRETNNFFASPTLYENIREFLLGEIIEICFTKKDGTERKMLCTLKAEHIPVYNTPILEDESGTVENKSYMNVFDVENNGWRSFIIDNVKYIKTNLEPI